MLFIVIGLGVLYFLVEIIQCKHEELKEKIMTRISNIPIGYQDSVIEGFLDDLPEKEIRKSENKCKDIPKTSKRNIATM